jgi:hypothetical protein
MREMVGFAHGRGLLAAMVDAPAGVGVEDDVVSTFSLVLCSAP